jgi:hypothetical protein
MNWIDTPAEALWRRSWRRLQQLVHSEPTPVATATRTVKARQQPIMKIAFGRLCSLSEGVLRSHIGSAAESVVLRARSEMEAFAATNRQISTNVFLAMLKKQFPAEADAGKIILEISNMVANASGDATQRGRFAHSGR